MRVGGVIIAEIGATKLVQSTVMPKKSGTPGKSINFSPQTEKDICADCDFRCAFPGCQKKVVPTRSVRNIGEESGEIIHIYPAVQRLGEFRYDETIPISIIKSRENGMLMCIPHHEEIDKKHPEKYPATVLIEMRKNHINSIKRSNKTYQKLETFLKITCQKPLQKKIANIPQELYQLRIENTHIGEPIINIRACLRAFQIIGEEWCRPSNCFWGDTPNNNSITLSAGDIAYLNILSLNMVSSILSGSLGRSYLFGRILERGLKMRLETEFVQHLPDNSYSDNFPHDLKLVLTFTAENYTPFDKVLGFQIWTNASGEVLHYLDEYDEKKFQDITDMKDLIDIIGNLKVRIDFRFLDNNTIGELKKLLPHEWQRLKPEFNENDWNLLEKLVNYQSSDTENVKEIQPNDTHEILSKKENEVIISLNKRINRIIREKSSAIAYGHDFWYENVHKVVIGLKIEGKNLRTLPPNFGDLTFLRDLCLNSNPLQNLPDSLCTLEALQYFEIYSCQLSNLPIGMGKLKNLKYLNLYHNNLTKLPPSFVTLKNLEYLDLRENKLKSLPEKLGSLQNLFELYLGNNPIEILPKSLRNLKYLKKLDLQYTHIDRDSSEFQKTYDILIRNNCEIYGP